MHLAYSALNQQSEANGNHPAQINNELLLRYQAYLNTCSKYSSHIMAIQKYFPGWVPKFR
jgi:hypothetical protein